MKAVSDFPAVYVYRPFTDMRKQILGLTVIIQAHMRLNPFDNVLFVFLNKRRDLMKCIYWDASGFAMWVKRLDQERFAWPKKLPEEVLVLPVEQMKLLLAGYDIWRMKKHKPLNFRDVS